MNAEGRWQGQADPPLSSAGREQAEALADQLTGDAIVAVYSSDLARAHETADHLGRALGVAVRTDARLREMDVGEWSGRPHETIRERWPADYDRMRAGDWEVRPGGGETRREVRTRAREVLSEIRAERADGRVAVVFHLGVLRALVPGIDLRNAESREFAWDALLCGGEDAVAQEGVL